MPANNRHVIVLSNQNSFFFLMYLARNSDIDVSNLVVEDWNEFDTGDLGDYFESLGMFPCL
jgi:hypothetical protein